MKITQDVREYAASHKFSDINVAVEEGMKENAEQFREAGADWISRARHPSSCSVATSQSGGRH